MSTHVIPATDSVQTLASQIKRLENQQILTPDELYRKLEERKSGTSFVTLSIATELEMVKKNRETGEPNPYYGQIEHQTTRQVDFGASYANRVNCMREEALRDGLALSPQVEEWIEQTSLSWYNPQPLWKGKGQFVNPYLCKHVDTGEVYLRYMLPERGGFPLAPQFDQYVHVLTGQVILKDDLLPYMKTIGDNKAVQLRQDDIDAPAEALAELSALSQRPVFFRTTKLRCIRSIVIDGISYLIGVDK